MTMNRAAVALAAAGLALAAADAQLEPFYFEGFDAVTLGPAIDETDPTEDPETGSGDVWSAEMPTGWFSISSAQDADINDTNVGVREWETWTVADATWWTAAAGDQDRTDFTVDDGFSAVGNVLVADPDEYDDRGSPFGTILGNAGYDARAYSPVITLPALNSPVVAFRFDSSWRDEDSVDAEIVVVFNGTMDPFEQLEDLDLDGDGVITPGVASGDGPDQDGFVTATTRDAQKGTLGEASAVATAVKNADLNDYRITQVPALGVETQVLLWESEGVIQPTPIDPPIDNPNFKGFYTNETVNIEIPVPTGATTMQFVIRHFNGSNDWWHAVDNFRILADTDDTVVVPPQAFDIVTPVAGSAQPLVTAFDWTDSDGATEYDIVVTLLSVDEGDDPVVVIDEIVTASEFTNLPGTLLAGQYSVEVTARNSAGELTRGPVIFNAVPTCPADLNGDEELNIFDILIYFSLFAAGC